MRSNESLLDSEPYRSQISSLIAKGTDNSTIARTIHAEHGLSTSRDSIRRFRKRHGWVYDAGNTQAQASIEPAACGLTVNGNEATIIEPPTMRPKLGDIGKLIRERGLDPEEWIVVSTTLNEWDGPIKGGGTQRLKQWKVTLRRAPHLVLVLPAQHVPALRLNAQLNFIPDTPTRTETIVVEGDHQAPYHDPALHQASLSLLDRLYRKHNLTEHVFLGDTGDFPTISRHADHPSAMANVNEVVQSIYDVLRDKREVAPNAWARKLKGNHDWRVESELLLRAERMYGIRPASIDGVEELPALSLRRLLHLDKMGIELVEDPRGWEHAEIELVPGPLGLVVRHGWLVGQNTAARSLDARGRSLIVGHKHERDTVYKWDAAAEVERQAHVNGVMCRRDKRFPHFAVLDRWSQGLIVVTRWGDGGFEIEHARWNGKYLQWRDQRFT